jgi:hypothetical protein
MNTSVESPRLIPGFYRCDACGETVDRVRKERRFWLCDDCYSRHVPQIDPAIKVRAGSIENQAITRYWEWFGELDERVPPRKQPGHAARTRSPGAPERPTDTYYPLCECGGRRETIRFGRAPIGLFGGPFQKECEICRIKREIESNVTATAWLHPEWDDEEWLDLLYKIMPAAFEKRILPDYWYALRKEIVKAGGDELPQGY